DHPQLPETLDHRPVVDDLVIDVQRRAEQLQSTLQAVDGHVDAGTEAARIGKDDLHAILPGTAPLSSTPTRLQPLARPAVNRSTRGPARTATPPDRACRRVASSLAGRMAPQSSYLTPSSSGLMKFLSPFLDTLPVTLPLAVSVQILAWYFSPRPLSSR